MSQTTEHDANPLNAAKLIEAIDGDRRLAREVLTKLPQWVRAGEDEDITFEIEPDVTIPSLNKIKSFAQSGLDINTGERVTNMERQMINVIGETVRLSQSMGINRLNPSWSAIDMMSSNTDGDTQNPLYSAAVDGGLRFAPEARAERQPTPKISGDAHYANSWLTGKHEAAIDEKVSPTAFMVGLYNYLMRNMSLSEVSRERLITRSYLTTETRTEKFGGYYRWETRSIINHNSNSRDLHQERVYVEGGTRQVSYNRINYYQARENYKEIVRSYTAPEEQSISGEYAVIAQTFYVPTPRVLFAVEYFEEDPMIRGADRKVMVCRCHNGQPLLTDVIAHGTPRFDGGGGRKIVTAWLNKPVMLNAKEQFAFVVMFNRDICPYYAPNDVNRTGQLMTTRDFYQWEKLLYNANQNNNFSVTTNGSVGIGYNHSMDLAFKLWCGRFSETEQEILLPNFELAGGISTAKTNFVTQMPNDGSCSIETMVKINERWEPLTILNQNVNLPPSTEAKLIIRGTQDVMPIINVEQSTYTLFRPKNNLTYVTKERARPANNVVKLALEVAGYDARYHTIDCVLLVGEQNTEVRPTVALSGSSSNGSTGTRRYEFQLPVGSDKYRIKVMGSTVNASVGFDISSIVEFH